MGVYHWQSFMNLFLVKKVSILWDNVNATIRCSNKMGNELKFICRHRKRNPETLHKKKDQHFAVAIDAIATYHRNVENNQMEQQSLIYLAVSGMECSCMDVILSDVKHPNLIFSVKNSKYTAFVQPDKHDILHMFW